MNAVDQEPDPVLPVLLAIVVVDVDRGLSAAWGFTDQRPPASTTANADAAELWVFKPGQKRPTALALTVASNVLALRQASRHRGLRSGGSGNKGGPSETGIMSF